MRLSYVDELRIFGLSASPLSSRIVHLISARGESSRIVVFEQRVVCGLLIVSDAADSCHLAAQQSLLGVNKFLLYDHSELPYRPHVNECYVGQQERRGMV